MLFFLSAFITGLVLGWFVLFPMLASLSDSPVKYKMTVPPRGDSNVPQYYYASTIVGLLWSMFTHRLGHWRRGEGFAD